MGAHPYWYFVDYHPDPEEALGRLKQREFDAGRYNPVMPFIEFPVNPMRLGPGAQHESIEDALEAAEADGTRSILDIQGVGNRGDLAMAWRLGEEELEALFGTQQPTRAMVEEGMDFFEEIDRGECIFFPVYRDGKPEALFFAGYSFD